MHDEYISREAALKALFAPGMCYAPMQLQIIKELPAADVAEVARCKGCKHAERYERIDGTESYYCGHPRNTFTYGERWDRVFKPVKEADEFCSYGERREE